MFRRAEEEIDLERAADSCHWRRHCPSITSCRCCSKQIPFDQRGAQECVQLRHCGFLMLLRRSIAPRIAGHQIDAWRLALVAWLRPHNTAAWWRLRAIYVSPIAVPDCIRMLKSTYWTKACGCVWQMRQSAPSASTGFALSQYWRDWHFHALVRLAPTTAAIGAHRHVASNHYKSNSAPAAYAVGVCTENEVVCC